MKLKLVWWNINVWQMHKQLRNQEGNSYCLNVFRGEKTRRIHLSLISCSISEWMRIVHSTYSKLWFKIKVGHSRPASFAFAAGATLALSLLLTCWGKTPGATSLNLSDMCTGFSPTIAINCFCCGVKIMAFLSVFPPLKKKQNWKI